MHVQSRVAKTQPRSFNPVAWGCARKKKEERQKKIGVEEEGQQPEQIGCVTVLATRVLATRYKNTNKTAVGNETVLVDG